MKISTRSLLYQVCIMAMIWSGMTYFLDILYDQGKIIYYIVTSWFLLLIVLLVKNLIRDRRERKN